MGGLGEGNSQSRSVLAVDRHGRKRCITFGLVGRETVDNQKAGGSEWYCLTGQPAFCPSFPQPVLCRPLPLLYLSGRNKEALAVCHSSWGNCMRTEHPTASVDSHINLTDLARCVVSFYCRAWLPPFGLQLTSPTSRMHDAI